MICLQEESPSGTGVLVTVEEEHYGNEKIKITIMNKFILFTLTICISIFMLSCNKLFPDEKLSMQQEDYNGNEVRTDGYYYTYSKSYNSSGLIADFTTVFFLYRNGIILSAGAYEKTGFDILEEAMLRRYESIQNKKTGWGVFIVKNNKIEYEQWSTSVGGGLPVFKNSYIIVNDTTLKRYNEIIYHFKQFSPKPDSTNVYIK